VNVEPTASLAADSEYLENGASDATPDGDNLLLDFARTEAAAFVAMVEGGGGRVEHTDSGVHLCDLGAAHPFGNPALVSRPIPDAATADVATQISSFYRDRPGGPFLVLSPWRTTDWREHGFEAVGHPPLMFRPVQSDRPGAPPSGVRIEKVSTVEQLLVFERVLVEAYPLPEMQPWVPGALLGERVLDLGWQLWIAFDGDRPVATAGAFPGPAVTVLDFVSTLAEARGRGIGSLLTHTAATTVANQPAMLISSDDGNGVYQRLGFVPLLRYTLWLGHRAPVDR
jgi:GNAT superfamily N-acetyltransferase